MSLVSKQRVGDLNGMWALAFKFATCCVPILCGVSGWAIVDRIHIEREITSRAKGETLHQQGERIRAIEALVPEEGFPPKSVWDRFSNLEQRMDRNLEVLDARIQRVAEKVDQLTNALLSKEGLKRAP